MRLQNWYYSITRFGRARNFVLYAFDNSSISECLTLGFACYNGTNLMNMTFTDEDVTHGNPLYYKLVWGKPFIMQSVLQRNYTVIFSDLDTVWFKNAARTMSASVEEHDADMLAMDNQHEGEQRAAEGADSCMTYQMQWLAARKAVASQAMHAPPIDVPGQHACSASWHATLQAVE